MDSELLQFDERYSDYNVTYTIQGPIAEVEAAIARLKKNYHPAGYGTAVRSRTQLREGEIVVVVKRSRSCD